MEIKTNLSDRSSPFSVPEQSRENTENRKLFCKGGGCTAKLGAGILNHILERLPKREQDPALLVGFDSRDDAAVYQITDDLAFVQTLDFFPPMIEDPFLFGQVAAANALSDIFAMGGRVKTALNIVCFPEHEDLNLLGEIMRGGALKVAEAGGSLAGGHSIADDSIKYGLSVTGLVHPGKIWKNDSGRAGDALILTKALGTGLICTAARVGQAPAGSLELAVSSMTTLNKLASELAAEYEIHACTDVTGFGLLGHLNEMAADRLSAAVTVTDIPVLDGARYCAEEFLLTAAAQRNRNHLKDRIRFASEVTFADEEILFDPQTSGGLLIALPFEESGELVRKLREHGLPAARIGMLTEKKEYAIYIEK